MASWLYERMVAWNTVLEEFNKGSRRIALVLDVIRTKIAGKKWKKAGISAISTRRSKIDRKTVLDMIYAVKQRFDRDIWMPSMVRLGVIVEGALSSEVFPSSVVLRRSFYAVSFRTDCFLIVLMEGFYETQVKRYI